VVTKRIASWGAAALAFSALVSGCAKERDPINRVQANAMPKTFFLGQSLSDSADDPEFYASSTVVDVPFGVTASVTTGSTGGLTRIKWQVTEDALLARKTYESVTGVDGDGSRVSNNGEVVASFKVLSHFDIKRDYNPQTGEELNVIVENTSDRPWYERDYMRVDWSSNDVTSAYSFDPLASLQLDGEDLEKLTYHVDDPKDPDAPVLDTAGGYLDVTNKVYVKSRTLTDLQSGQKIVPCMYSTVLVGGGGPAGVCDSAEVKLRLSFLRLAQPGEPGYRDYQVKEWDGARMSAAGAFTQDRLGYDRQYGIIDSNWHRFIQRYNIWQKSHTDIQCAAGGAADQCQAAGAPAGSRCDEFASACTIPYALRQTRPNAWHFNFDADDVAFESTAHAAEEWDTALRVAVQAARLVECRQTGAASLAGSPWEGFTDCDQAFPINQTDDAEVEAVRHANRCAKGLESPDVCTPPAANSVTAIPTMIALCHNPVAAGDDPMCGKTGLFTRPGDLRYHQVNVIPTAQSASPWGYGPSNSDPLTGEVIQASINVWNTVTDTTAQLLVDTARWINGEIPTTQVTNGEYVSNWAAAASAHAPGSSSLLSRAEIDKKILGSGGTSAIDLANAQALARTPQAAAGWQKMMTSVASTLTPSSAASGANTAEADARLALAKGTPTEAALVGPAWLQMAGIDPSSQVTNDVLERASPLRGLDGRTLARAEQQLTSALAKKGQCMLLAPEPTAVVPLAKILAQKFPYDAHATEADQATRSQKMWNYLRGKLNYAVIAHEMGHTLGMRHNFTSSYDKFNFRPQYWQLRTRGGTVHTACTGPVADGSTCVGPRYYDPLDQDEVDQMEWMWAQTTVMDYAGDPTQDTIGLGVYDYAAMRAFYADVVDVRKDTSGLSSQVVSEMVNFVDNILPIGAQSVSDKNGDFVHYSQWNDHFGLLNQCTTADTSPPAWWNADKDGAYSPVFDGHIVRGEHCDRMTVDYVPWEEMVSDNLRGRLGFDPASAPSAARVTPPVGRACLTALLRTSGSKRGSRPSISTTTARTCSRRFRSTTISTRTATSSTTSAAAGSRSASSAPISEPCSATTARSRGWRGTTRSSTTITCARTWTRSSRTRRCWPPSKARAGSFAPRRSRRRSRSTISCARSRAHRPVPMWCATTCCRPSRPGSSRAWPTPSSTSRRGRRASTPASASAAGPSRTTTSIRRATGAFSTRTRQDPTTRRRTS